LRLAGLRVLVDFFALLEDLRDALELDLPRVEAGLVFVLRDLEAEVVFRAEALFEAAFFVEDFLADDLAAVAAPPFLPPFLAEALLVFLPRPDPLFLPPPVLLLTVAQARRSASFSLTPRFS
jgi:hypothetical protein